MIVRVFLALRHVWNKTSKNLLMTALCDKFHDLFALDVECCSQFPSPAKAEKGKA